MSKDRDPGISTLQRPSFGVPGQQIGTYTIHAVMGSGQLTTVCQAQSRNGETVIITLFHVPPFVPYDAFMMRFLLEASALSKRSHPHLLVPTDYGEHTGIPFLVTPAIEGETLTSYLSQHGPCSSEETSHLLEALVALDALHERGLFHLGMHPGNIIIDRHQHLWIVGIGLTQILRADGLDPDWEHSLSGLYPHLFSIAGSYLGHPAYLAPERVLGQAVDARADLYALGVLLYELLMGMPPFTGKDFITTCTQPLYKPFPSLCGRADLQAVDGLNAVIQQATSCLPELRFESVRELTAAYHATIQPAPCAWVQAPHSGADALRQEDEEMKPSAVSSSPLIVTWAAPSSPAALETPHALSSSLPSVTELTRPVTSLPAISNVSGLSGPTSSLQDQATQMIVRMLAQQRQHFLLATVLLAGIEALSQRAPTNAGDISRHPETAKEQVFPSLSETFRPLSGSFTPFSASLQEQAERGEKVVDSYLVQTHLTDSMDSSSSLQTDFQKDHSLI